MLEVGLPFWPACLLTAEGVWQQHRSLSQSRCQRRPVRVNADYTNVRAKYIAILHISELIIPKIYTLYTKGVRRIFCASVNYRTVLLPTNTSNFLAQRKDAYPVIKWARDVFYEVDMIGTQKKRHWIFHINMVKKWNEVKSLLLF